MTVGTGPAPAARGPSRALDTSPPVSDEVKYTTCYMCACRCGIKVHFKDGKLRYIEGNRDHPVNRGVLCAKGSAGIMQHLSPARLSKPLLRVGERGTVELLPEMGYRGRPTPICHRAGARPRPRRRPSSRRPRADSSAGSNRVLSA